MTSSPTGTYEVVVGDQSLKDLAHLLLNFLENYFCEDNENVSPLLIVSEDSKDSKP